MRVVRTPRSQFRVLAEARDELRTSARIYRERLRVAVVIVRGRGHIAQLIVGDDTREYFMVERER